MDNENVNKENIQAFLDSLTSDQMHHFAATLDQLEKDIAYEKLASELNTSVEQVKAAELINDLVMSGFYSGLEDLNDGAFDEIMKEVNDHGKNS